MSELRDYAESLILSRAQDIEFLTISEVAEDNLGRELTQDELEEVDRLIARATVVVTWDE
jgi:hypothetical protein